MLHEAAAGREYARQRIRPIGFRFNAREHRLLRLNCAVTEDGKDKSAVELRRKGVGLATRSVSRTWHFRCAAPS
jgi:hypothetical protein